MQRTFYPELRHATKTLFVTAVCVKVEDPEFRHATDFPIPNRDVLT
jgi:hypothetical protein